LTVLAVVDHEAQSALPGINPGWRICSELFLEKTPEESDDATTPHENRPDLSKPGGINDHFLTRFVLFRTVILEQECRVTPCITLGPEIIGQKRRMLRIGV